MILVFNNEDGSDFIYQLECVREEFIEWMAEKCDCDESDIEDEWTIISTDQVIPQTIEEFF